MKTTFLILFLAITASAMAQIVHETNVTVETLAGSGFSGNVDGVGTETMFYNPSRIVFDGAQTLFIVDKGGNPFSARLRKLIIPSVTVSTLQTNQYPFGPSGIHFRGPIAGEIFLTTRYSIQSINLTSSNSAVFAGEPSTPGNESGAVLDARFDVITDIEVNAGGTIFVSDTAANNKIRAITNGNVFTYAGSGNFGYEDGNGIFSSFTTINAICMDSAGNIYVGDGVKVRKISGGRFVSTLAGFVHNSTEYSDGFGTNASFREATGICINQLGEIFVSDRLAHSIRKIDLNGMVTTVAGNGFSLSGYANGDGQSARFKNPSDVAALPDGSLLVADAGNNRIRRISFSGSPPIGEQPALAINNYAGLDISGTPGRTYKIESSLEMTNWNQEAIISLPSTKYLWIDTNSPSQSKKFYRATLQ